MISKAILILSFVLLLIIIFERTQNNIVFTFYFKYGVKESEVTEKLLFRDYLIKFNKSYSSGEFEMRYQRFKKNLIKIETLNRASRHAKYGVTKFSDWTSEELVAVMLPKLGMCEPRYNKTCTRPTNRSMYKNNKDRITCCKQRGLASSNVSASSDRWKEWSMKRLRRKEMCKCGSRVIRNTRMKKIPSKLDWREKHAVGPILDQRRCAVCWAFSIIGVMESRAFIQNYGLNQLSIQELIDCSFYHEKSKTGCHSGRAVVEALGYLCEKKFKITTESNYPLTLADEKCRRTGTGIRGISRFFNNCEMYKNEGKLLEELTRGPVVALVYAELLLNYNSGVIAENCQTTVDKLNHAVQIVGYDTTANPPYYILRNSWGKDWGENGYARLAVGGNQCGVAFSVAYFDVN